MPPAVVDPRTDAPSSTTANRAAPSKAVRFDVQSQGELEGGEQLSMRPRPRRHPKHLKEPTPMPAQIYGLYLSLDVCVNIGLKILPQEEPKHGFARKSLMFLGVRCSNSHCQRKFPHIPLRWRTCVFVLCEQGMRPLLILGHRYSGNDEKIYVTHEHIEELRAYLQLGDQQPAWYPIEHVYGQWCVLVLSHSWSSSLIFLAVIPLSPDRLPTVISFTFDSFCDLVPAYLDLSSYLTLKLAAPRPSSLHVFMVF